MSDGPISPVSLESEPSGPQTSGKAIAGLVLGVMAVFCCAFTGIPAVIFGALGLRDVNASRGRLTGSGMAITGIVLGSVFSVISTFAGIAILLPAFAQARLAAQASVSKHHLREIALATLNYHEENKSFPLAASANGKEATISWRVELLRHYNNYDLDKLFIQYDRTEAWDSSANKTVTDTFVEQYVSQADPKAYEPITNFFAVIGEGFIFQPSNRTRYSQIGDGAADTILYVEYVPSEIRWTEPRDLTFQEFAQFVASSSRGPFQQGFNVVMADGSVRTLPPGIPEDVLYALFTINGGETLNLPWK